MRRPSPRRLPAFLLPTLLCVSAPLAAQAVHPNTGLPVEDPVIAAIHAEAERDNQVMQHLDELANGIGPRLTSSSNLTEACEWAAQRFRDFGLENVRLERWDDAGEAFLFPVGYDRIYSRGRLTAPVKRPLTFASMAWAAGTDGPVRGPVRRAPADAEALESARGTLAGAWVVLGNLRPRYGSGADDFRSRLGRFLDEEGIAGTIRTSRNELVRTGGSRNVSMDDLPKRVEVTVVADDAREIFRLLEAGEEVEAEFDIAVRFVPGPIPLYNVIAEIPGTEKPEELVIVGGHLDSWDGATGTQDNGTGTATTLEAARLLAAVGAKPRRTIRFMLWSGEEQGLLGSRAYILEHPEETPLVSAVLVHDGGTNACAGITATPDLLPIFEEAFAPIVEMTADYEDPALRFQIRKVDTLPYMVGSDHDSYFGAGVPGFFWNQRGTASYGYVHHTQNDLYQSAVEAYQLYSSEVIAMGAWRVASLPEMLPREGLPDPNRRRGSRPRPNRRLLGVRLADGTLRVSEVTQGGLAAKAGLKPGDLLVSIDEAALKSLDDLRGALANPAPQRKLVIEREGKRLSWTIDWEKGTATQIE